MRIELQPPRGDGGLEFVSGLVVWEDSVAEPREVYAGAPAGTFERPATAHWLLLSIANVAVRRGERRIAIEGEVDPVVLRGLEYVQTQLQTWYGDRRILIDAPSSAPAATPHHARTAVFLSGGVDSIACLLRNRNDFPREHPWSIDDAVVVDWVGPAAASDLRGTLSAQHTRVLSLLQPIADEFSLTLLPVVTNVRRVDRNDFHYDWMFRDHGAHLSGVAHLLDGRVARALIASTYDLRTLAPWGSHPLLDQWYGSSTVQIVHDSPDWSRLEKLRLLARRSTMPALLHVCSFWFQRGEGETLNCGRCEKCLRTLVGLEAVGVATETLTGFERTDLVAGVAMLDHFQDEYERACWKELAEPLRDQGRRVLAAAVDHLIERVEVRNPVVGARRA